VDRLRLDAVRILAAFPATLAGYTELGYPVGQALLATPITTAEQVAAWVDSIFNASVPLPAGAHSGVLPAGAGYHHYPKPIVDIDRVRYDDFRLFVTDPRDFRPRSSRSRRVVPGMASFGSCVPVGPSPRCVLLITDPQGAGMAAKYVLTKSSKGGFHWNLVRQACPLTPTEPGGFAMKRPTRARRLLCVLSVAGALTAGTLTPLSPAQAAIAGTVVGGLPIYGSLVNGKYEQCTAGFNARNAAGDKVLITAGHCGRRDWRAPNGLYFGATGRVVVSPNGGDFQTVAYTNPSYWKAPGRVLYNGQRLPVRGILTPSNGARVCWRGGASATTRCGALFEVGGDSTVSGTTYHNTFKIHGCAIRGDSGGPIYAEVTDSLTHESVAFAIGIVQGVTGCSGSNNTVVGQPIRKVLRRWNLKLTTA